MSQAHLDLNAELKAARQAVHGGNHAAAVGHLARVVRRAPAHPAVRAVLEDLVSAVGDPLSLLPGGPVSYGAAAIHAYALGKTGQAFEAYQILRRLAQANPANGIIDWALDWLDAGALGPAERDAAVDLFLLCARHRGYNDRPRLRPDEAALVGRWLPHFRAMLDGRPLDDPYYDLFVALLRKAGRQEEATQVVQARFEAHPSYDSAVSLAATLRDGRDFAGWYDACQRCLEFRPDGVSVRLNLGDCLWEEQGKLDEAERWYADALRIEPGHPWATPSVLAIRYLRTGESRWRDELEDYAWANADNDRARVALDRVTPFFAGFVHPEDASVDCMNKIAAQVDAFVAGGGSPGSLAGRITLAATGPGCPSCRRSFDRQLGLWGGRIKVDRDVRVTQSPDPREPRAPVQYRVWEYDGQTPRPAVAPPPPEVARVVAAIAETRYDLGDWSRHALEAAGRLSPSNLPGLLGAMAHPPGPPAGWRAWDWTARVQVAAALVIGHLGQGWEGTERRQALIDLANGPTDWTTVAAVVALTAVALEEPAIAPEVGRLFAGLYQDLPRPGAGWYENAILNCHLRLPGLSETERSALRAARAEFEARSGKRLSDAEAAARVLLAHPMARGIDDGDLGSLVIQAFAKKVAHDHPDFPEMVRTTRVMAEAAVEDAEGERLQYLREQVEVLRLIEKEMTPTSEPAAVARPA